jgi:hypothetical protein
MTSNLPPLAQASAAAAGAVLSNALVYPLDTMTTRLQTAVRKGDKGPLPSPELRPTTNILQLASAQGIRLAALRLRDAPPRRGLDLPLLRPRQRHSLDRTLQLYLPLLPRVPPRAVYRAQAPSITHWQDQQLEGRSSLLGIRRDPPRLPRRSRRESDREPIEQYYSATADADGG